MAAGQNTPLAGYPMPLGAKYLTVFDHNGPTSYTQAGIAGVVSSGGDVINALDIGIGGFDVFESDMVDSTGQLYALVIATNGGSGNAVPSVRVVWYSRVTATVGGQAQTANTEVAASTNLSTFVLRCRALGV